MTVYNVLITTEVGHHSNLLHDFSRAYPRLWLPGLLRPRTYRAELWLVNPVLSIFELASTISQVGVKMTLIFGDDCPRNQGAIVFMGTPELEFQDDKQADFNLIADGKKYRIKLADVNLLKQFKREYRTIFPEATLKAPNHSLSLSC